MGGWRKLGIIAGGGALPARIANERKTQGQPFHVVRISGSADKGTEGFAGDDFALGEAGKILKSLKDNQCDAVCFAGIVRRPDFSTLRVDWRGAALMPKILAAAAQGDGAILNVLVDMLEAENFLVIGADEVVRELTAPAGVLGAHAPDEGDRADIRKAAAIIKALGPFDVGQGAVVAGGHVLAIEAAEGTDAMLLRCADLRKDSPDANKRHGGVLAKRPKPGQELRVDLPAIGPQTIENAAAAGLSGVAVEAGAALILNGPEVVEKADALNLFVYGFSSKEVE
ncbi:MAG: UDP-2,3-diacylglucosamine diphosphatase LpxI [Pseudomonadota bacterium]